MYIRVSGKCMLYVVIPHEIQVAGVGIFRIPKEQLALEVIPTVYTEGLYSEILQKSRYCLLPDTRP